MARKVISFWMPMIREELLYLRASCFLVLGGWVGGWVGWWGVVVGEVDG